MREGAYGYGVLVAFELHEAVAPAAETRVLFHFARANWAEHAKQHVQLLGCDARTQVLHSSKVNGMQSRRDEIEWRW